MNRTNAKAFLFAVKLIGLLLIAFPIIVYAPQHAHHLLLVVAVVLAFLGAGALFKYKAQANWVEKKARLKSIHEREEDVALSERARLKYYYPEVEYEYVANGSLQTGKTVAFEKENVWVPEVNNWGDPTPVEDRWWLSLKPGDELPVYVNPRNETEAVLVKDAAKARRSHHLALLVSGILLGLIWAFLVTGGLTMTPGGG